MYVICNLEAEAHITQQPDQSAYDLTARSKSICYNSGPTCQHTTCKLEAKAHITQQPDLKASDL